MTKAENTNCSVCDNDVSDVERAIEIVMLANDGQVKKILEILGC